MADPERIADIARLALDLALDGVVVLADGRRVLALLQDRWVADSVDRQLRAGDIVLVSKIDEMSSAEVQEVLAELETRIGPARVHRLSDSGWEDIFALRTAFVHPVRDQQTITHRFSTRSLREDHPLSVPALRRWLQGHQDIYRLEGWLRDSESGQLLLIQGVGRTVISRQRGTGSCPVLRCSASVRPPFRVKRLWRMS